VKASLSFARPSSVVPRQGQALKGQVIEVAYAALAAQDPLRELKNGNGVVLAVWLWL